MFQGKWVVPASIVISALLVALALIYRAGSQPAPSPSAIFPADFASLEKLLIEVGVIDASRFTENVRTELNLLWAFGLANENRILTEGPMMDPRYGGAGNFASTGGWTLAKGSAMDHYAMHRFITLTEEEQELVERVSQNIYRPCCGNPVYFPDCNHGMAMLGFLELMAADGVSEDEMYRAALAMNRKWFPDTYDTIDRYLSEKHMPSAEENPKLALSYDYSSVAGYQRVLTEVAPSPSQGGGSCGV